MNCAKRIEGRRIDRARETQKGSEREEEREIKGERGRDIERKVEK